jgi:hypothetical protein
MRKLFLSLLVLSCSLLAKAEDKTLIITFSDNTTQTFVLSTLPQISMANDKMTITTSSTTAEYDLYKVKTFTFGTVTGIQNIGDNTSISMKGDKIIVSGINAKVRIFAIDGKAVSTTPIQADGQTIIALDTLPTGVYIINVNGKSVKISKQ